MRNCLVSSLLLLLASTGGVQGLAPLEHYKVSSLKATNCDTNGSMSRRKLFGLTVASAVLFGVTKDDSALAFANKISDKYDDRPKRRGPQPKDLGIGTRKDMVGDEYVGLKNCGGAPNCFCSTDDPEDDPDHYIPAWIWPKDLDKAQAFAELEEVLKAYEPGQNGVDGGGFQIVKSDTKTGYIYTQFEALKNGYIDDFEVAYIAGAPGGDRAVQVRSSSRVGYLDFGVNAKRVNFIATNLRAKGWDAAGVDYNTHRNYAIQNEVA